MKTSGDQHIWFISKCALKNLKFFSLLHLHWWRTSCSVSSLKFDNLGTNSSAIGYWSSTFQVRHLLNTFTHNNHNIKIQLLPEKSSLVALPLTRTWCQWKTLRVPSSHLGIFWGHQLQQHDICLQRHFLNVKLSLDQQLLASSNESHTTFVIRRVWLFILHVRKHFPHGFSIVPNLGTWLCLLMFLWIVNIIRFFLFGFSFVCKSCFAHLSLERQR